MKLIVLVVSFRGAILFIYFFNLLFICIIYYLFLYFIFCSLYVILLLYTYRVSSLDFSTLSFNISQEITVNGTTMEITFLLPNNTLIIISSEFSKSDSIISFAGITTTISTLFFSFFFLFFFYCLFDLQTFLPVD
jgi:hypothetical protein